jgi:hypothetical protein
VASKSDDPRRDPRTQTADGTFAAVCPGRAAISVTAGWETGSTTVTVPSTKGRLQRSIQRTRTMRRGRRGLVARVRLAQPAVVSITVRRGKSVVTRVPGRCATSSRSLRWTPRRAGRYTVEVKITSDRDPIFRRSRLTVQ